MKSESKDIKKTNNRLLNIVLLFVVCSTMFAVNSFGQSITWQRVLENNYGGINKIQQTTDGGYIAVGDERINNQNKIYLVKLDYLGNTIWDRIIGLGENQGNWVEQTTDGGFIIGGSTTLGLFGSKAYLVKTDSLGNIQWERTFTNSDLDQCYCVKQTPDGGYILTCSISPFNNGIAFKKTDLLGYLQFQKVYYNDTINLFAREIEILNNDYIAVGDIQINNEQNIFIMRLNNQLDTIWTKSIGGKKADWGMSIDNIDNKDFIIAGYTYSFSTNYLFKSYVCKMDTNANIKWQKTFSNIGSEACNSIRFKQNQFIMACFSDSLNNDLFKAKLRILDSNGKNIYEKSYLPSNNYAIFNSIEHTFDGGYIGAGIANYIGNYSKMYIIKTDSLLHALPIGISSNVYFLHSNFKLFQNYPNPFNTQTNIIFELNSRTYVRLIIYDMLGKEVYNFDFGDLIPGNYNKTWNAGEYNSGIYFYRILTDKYTESKKMIFIK